MSRPRFAYNAAAGRARTTTPTTLELLETTGGEPALLALWRERALDTRQDAGNEWRERRLRMGCNWSAAVSDICILVTGGTFDKEYDEIAGTLFFKDTHLPEMLRLGRCRLDVTIRTVMMVDSLDMTDADRALIVSHCRDSSEDRIVVLHGTDTMADTARAVAAGADGPIISAKTVVLTGAMVPYAFGSSDGLFNLGSALSFVQLLPAGVYIAMNGKCFRWNEVRKNRETGVFEDAG